MNALFKNEMVESKIMGNRYYFCFRPHEKTNIIQIYRYTVIILCHWGMILGMLGKGMVIYMQNVNEVDLAVKPEELIARLRNGEEHLRDFMLEYYQKYILSLVSKMIGRPAWTLTPSTDSYNQSPTLVSGTTYYFSITYVFENGKVYSDTVTCLVP